MKTKKVWQLIVDEVPLKGSLNMAVDDYLFRSTEFEDSSQTYLRFYQWKRPTVSLGYSQKMDKVVDVDYCRQNGIDLVRRLTGGKLVLHFKEVTYSICSSDIETFSTTLKDSYRYISQALIQGLEKMGLESFLAGAPPSSYARGNLPCFSYPARDEVETKGKKIIGSAQKRIGNRFIQHGSIPLEEDEGLLEPISFLQKGKSKERMTSISQAIEKKVSFKWVVDNLLIGFSEYFGISFQNMTFTENEKKEISEIQKRRYEDESWTFSRKES